MKERVGATFPQVLKEQVRQAQHHCCAICGSETHLAVHHKTPKSQGSNGIDNADGVCRDCHDLLDHLTLERGIPFEQIKEAGISYLLAAEPIEERPTHMADLRYPKRAD